MFEAKLAEGHILKKIIEAIKDIVNDVNLDVSPSGKYSLYTFISTFKAVVLLFIKMIAILILFYIPAHLNDHLMVYRNLTSSHGYLTCCSCFFEPQHGRI